MYTIFSAACTAAGFGSSLTSSSSAVSLVVFSGWLSFDPSRYSAFALIISCHDSRYAAFTSSIVASYGMLIVLLIAPLMNGWAAAIIRMWLSADR